jgi:hypothetical protein
VEHREDVTDADEQPTAAAVVVDAVAADPPPT